MAEARNTGLQSIRALLPVISQNQDDLFPNNQDDRNQDQPPGFEEGGWMFMSDQPPGVSAPIPREPDLVGRPKKDYIAQLRKGFGESNITVTHVVRLGWCPDFCVDSDETCKRLLEKVNNSKLTVFRRYEQECSLTLVMDAAGRSCACFCEADNALRREIVIVADIKEQILASIRKYSWEDMEFVTTEHRSRFQDRPNTMCCIACSPRFKEKLMHAAIDGGAKAAVGVVFIS
eukprot:g44155.t1